jgi:hypothetical protein
MTDAVVSGSVAPVPVVPDFAALSAQVLAEFPSWKMVNKADSWMMKAISPIMPATFMTNFISTIRYTMYVPVDFASWPAVSQCALVRHEREHMRQSKKLTFPLYLFLYALVFLPIGLSYFRTLFEQAGYAEQMAAWKEYGEPYSDAETKQWVCAEFTGSSYGWMWIFSASISRWFDGVVAKLDA